MLTVCVGASRVVVISAGIAVKFPRGEVGRLCNLFEAGVWQRNRDHPTRGRHLCPVLWCHPKGNVLIMPAAEPLDSGADPMATLDAMHEDWWDYVPPGDEDPCEPKAEDWGMLEGELVAVDYAATAL